MGLSKNLFLGVYASNPIIRALFLPMCYAFLASPFALLVIRNYGLDQLLYDYIPTSYKRPEALPQLFVSLVAVLLVTRLVTGNRHGTSQKGGQRRVQLLPYWLPYLRHCAHVVFGGQRWMKDVSDSSIDNIIGYNLAGAQHTLVLYAPLLQELSTKSASLAETELSKWIIPRNAFSMPKSAKAQYLQLRQPISSVLEEEVFSGGQMKKLVAGALAILSQTLPDLTTFNSSLVDQMQWERVADVELTDGTEEVECKLFDLVNEFLCNAVIPPITGPQFPESYQLLATDLADFNKYFYKLALGFPRLFPIPGLPSAAFARRRLLQNLQRLFRELSSPPVQRSVDDDESQSGEETDAETPTPLTALNELFTKHNVPLAVRASVTLELLHTILAEVIPLSFWTLLHIYSQSPSSPPTPSSPFPSDTPLSRIRHETHFFATATQPPSLHPSFPAPPSLTYPSPSDLFSPSSFPYLRSCIRESRRLYTSSLATACLTTPISLTESHPARPSHVLSWTLAAGTFIDIGLSQTLINTSPSNHLAAEKFIPDRFLDTTARAPDSVSPFDTAEGLTTALVAGFVAGVVQLWDLRAAPRKGVWEHLREAQEAAAGGRKVVKKGGGEREVGVWVVPEKGDGAEGGVPRGEVRVRIRRREGLEETGVREREIPKAKGK
ncbi:hypothetical protein EJ04DRAFT_499066 [Polyplosphaeria fusca]|uniref:Cytochrome P450 n=1 Tax=Polyplosphaeria fusca TaxID=682080 RepID=A0A9P4QR98_9PLEO|nr:hypothetical protein EJ04DRAFT_499066 [Polyplosphaeria fusca]